MAPRRGGRSAKIINNIDYNNLKLSESLCPICRSILIEPVTLSCNHGFCLSCFEGTMANSNLVCPLCRTRIGSWLRTARKENKLVNTAYWQALKEQFPVQIQNRLEGLEENLPEDDPKIKIADPGEIRKEYEVQKKKDDEEFQRLKALEEKASESLLKEYQEELEFQKVVEEEKIKLDEQVARKLAEKFSAETAGPSMRPSTSKSNSAVKKLATLDEFLKAKSPAVQSSKNMGENVTYTSRMQKNLHPEFNCNVMLKDFVNKEYTCVILRQNQNQVGEQPSSSGNLSFIKKKSQQLQKLTEADCVSDSSDCIESECRYFKPIDYKYNPRTQYKCAVKVPSRTLKKSSSCIIRPPNGKVLFEINPHSAFARVQVATVNMSEKSEAVIKDSDGTVPNISYTFKNENTASKRKHHRSNCSSHSRKKIKLFECGNSSSNNNIVKARINGKVDDPPRASESPPFTGFKRENLRSQLNKLNNNNNGMNNSNIDAQELKKRLQEKADLEFAKKLHEELNGISRYPRRNISSNNSNNNSKNGDSKRNTRRQVTLDEIMVPCRIK